MTSYKIPSLKCPACCPGSRQPVNFSNGLQVPINLSKGKLRLDQPRRFTGRDWRQRLGGFNDPKPKTVQNSRQSWSGGPGGTGKTDMASEFGSIGDMAESGITSMKSQWTLACAEVGAAVKYLRHLWLTTSGNYSQKIIAVNRMVCFYLILLGLYIAETCFWVDQQLLNGLCAVILRPKRNADMLMGLGAVVAFIFLLYLIGGPAASPGVCCTGD